MSYCLIVICLICIIPGSFHQVNIIAVVDKYVTLDCSTSTIKYPQWKGPGDVLYNYAGYAEFNMNTNQSTRLQWNSDDRSLVLLNITRLDAGNYLCFYQSQTKPYLLNVRVPPTSFNITNTETITANRTIIRVNEDSTVALECSSSGGYPESIVQWFREESFTTPLSSNVTSVLQGDQTYTLVSRHIFTARRSDDMKRFVCQTRFETEPALNMSIKIEVYLQLKPNSITVQTKNFPKEGENTTVAVCMASGFRPENGIIAYWLFKNTSINTKIISSINSVTETFAVTINFTMSLSREDNDQQLVCVIDHSTLDEPLTRTSTLKVKFPPKSVSLSGNATNIANTTNTIELNCTTDVSNPASNISWIHSDTIPLTTGSQLVTEGHYHGTVTSQSISIIPTRDMNGEVIKCEATHEVIDAPVTTETKLDILYNPIVNVSISSPTVPEGQSNIVLLCSANSKPKPRFVWLHHGDIVSESDIDDELESFQYTIDNITRNQTGEYKCEASNSIKPNGRGALNLTVEFAPRFVTLSGNTHVTANGFDNVTLLCETDSANPKATITWKLNNNTILNKSTHFEKEGEFGGFITSEQLGLLATMNMNSKHIECLASNGILPGRTVQHKVRLNITYEPEIRIENIPEITVEEMNNITLSCEVISNPLSSITWSRDNETLQFGAEDNTLKYTLFNITRYERGQYFCSASNGIGQLQMEAINITVQYAPDVIVSAQNASVNDSQLEILCSPTGVPSNYTYSNWQQFWPSYGQVTPAQGLGNNRTLVLSHLTYQQSGKYQCTVSNSVSNSINQEAGVGEVYINVKSRPVVFFPNTTEEERFDMAVKLNTPTYICINVYSNALRLTGNCCDKTPNDSTSTADFTSVKFVPSLIELSVFDHTVKTDGYNAELNVTLTEKNEFGNYYVTFSNEIGETKALIAIVERGPPYPPKKLTISDISKKSVVASWKPSFNGGDAQTFIIQLRTNLTWTNQTTVRDTGEQTLRATLVDLTPFMAYYARMFAVNENGASEGFSNVANFITLRESEGSSSPESSSSKLNLGPIFGALFGGIIITALVVVAVVLLRRSPSGHSTHEVENDDYDDHEYEDIDGATSNTKKKGPNLYEDIIPGNRTDPLYSEVKPETAKGKRSKVRSKIAHITKPKCDQNTYQNMVLNPDSAVTSTPSSTTAL